MKLKIRYENEIQTIELDEKATEEMWVSLSLEGEGLSQKEREELIQRNGMSNSTRTITTIGISLIVTVDTVRHLLMRKLTK